VAVHRLSFEAKGEGRHISSEKRYIGEGKKDGVKPLLQTALGRKGPKGRDHERREQVRERRGGIPFGAGGICIKGGSPFKGGRRKAKRS